MNATMPDLRFFLRAGFLCFLLVSAGGTAAFAEAAPGTLFGTVTDAGTGESLPGATVRIDGTSLGAATDLDGHYRIPRVPEGDHVVVVSYVGYKAQRVPVTVSSDEDRRLDVALELDVVEGQEIVITAQAEGQVAAINQQLASNQIVSVVSAARIQELPDANAAESVGRLPGISIQRDAGEGQKVVIRGLSPKYNNVTVNGVKLPATDFNDRSTDLNMVSPDMLAGIEVFKALTPDQDADAIGGAVNFRLRGAPAGLRANALLQGGYSGLTKDIGPYKTNLTLSNRFFGDRLGVFVQGNLEHADRSSERMNAGFINQARSSQDTSRVLLTENLDLRDRTETRDRYGASLLMDYTLPGGSLQFTNFFNRLGRDYVSRDNTFSTAVVAASYDLREARLQTDVWSTALSGEFRMPAGATLTFNLNRSSSLLDKPYDSRMRFTQNSAFDTGNLVRDQGPQVVHLGNWEAPWGIVMVVDQLSSLMTTVRDAPLPGFAETLMRSDVDFAEPERATFLRYIASESERLTAIVDRLLAERIPYPIHLGITEAGTKWSGSLKSSVGLGTLLADGMPIVWLARLMGIPIRSRVAGATLFEALRAKLASVRPWRWSPDKKTVLRSCALWPKGSSSRSAAAGCARTSPTT